METTNPLERLRQDLTKMSPDELNAKIRAIREDRKISKVPPKKAAAVRKAAKTKTDKAKDLFAGLDDAAKAQMLKLLGDG
jgi:hypothetical protein